MVSQVRQAESAGLRSAWSTVGGAGGAEVLTTYAAVLTQTESITLSTAIIPTWPRHPITAAQQALALDQLAPGRFRLGVGPSHEGGMTRGYGVRWRTPLTHLREYLEVLRALLDQGSVDFEGAHWTARSRIREPRPLPIIASALRTGSYEACGELADGAISWMSPLRYLLDGALPAIARGAERADREPPPLIAHVPFAVSEDRAAVRELARAQLSFYADAPFYQQMFAAAGFPGVSEGYSDALLDDLVISGTEDEVVASFAAMIDSGVGEVLAAPLIHPDDRDGSIASAFAAAARADAEVQ
jgi:F420-dependent oxidoreductase-like protein